MSRAGRLQIAGIVVLLVLLAVPSNSLRAATTIDFEQFSAPTFPTGIQPTFTIGVASFSGGQLLGIPPGAHLPVLGTTVYYTSFFCPGCLPTLTIDFSQPVSQVSFFVINAGMVTYLVRDDRGDLVTLQLVPSHAETVRLPSNNVLQVTITGSTANWDFLIDNLTFENGCIPPRNGAGVTTALPRRIDFPDWCFIPIGRIWAQDFSDGSKLEVTCQGLFSPTYMLWYTSPSGSRHRIGQCLFNGGVNFASYIASPDSDNDRKPDCLVSAEWVTIDGGANDRPRGVGGFVAGGFVFTTPEEPYLDVVTYNYDANSNKLSWVNSKYEYPLGSNQIPRDAVFSYVFGQGRQAVPGAGHVEDPPVGVATDILFDGLLALLPSNPPGPMTLIVGCDLNGDGRCDTADRGLLNGALGTCVGDANFVSHADADRDGCITPNDADAFSASYAQFGGTCTFRLGYWKRHTDQWPVTSLQLGSRSYTKPELSRILRQPAKGNGLVVLARHLIAAKLNAGNGAPAPLATIAAADSLIDERTGGGAIPPIGRGFVSRSETAPLTILLKNYSQGLTPPGVCNTLDADNDAPDDD